MYKDIVEGGLNTLDKARTLLMGAKADSYIEYSRVGRVEPTVLIDRRAMNLPEIGDIQQSLLSIFAGYYLQAASISNQVGNIRVLDRLEQLSPNRSPLDNLVTGNRWLFATESYENGLPFLSDQKLKVEMESLNVAMEADKPQPKMTKEEKEEADRLAAVAEKDRLAKDKTDPARETTMSRGDVARSMNELANLSVGKMYNIEISDGKASVSVPINIRLIATQMDPTSLVHILATGSEDESFKERWHSWRSGHLEFWKDLVLATDRIQKHRRDLVKDQTGTIAAISRTGLSNKISTLITGNPSIAAASNLVVMTRDTAEELEMSLEGKLSRFDIRERMFSKTYLMILVVADRDHRTVTFYHRGISQPTVVRFNDLNTGGKGGVDVSDVLKAYLAGSAPSL